MKYFTIQELSKSSTAITNNIDNTPSITEKKNLTLLIENILDKVREAYGKPIIVDSGFRCAKLNKMVGGSSTSLHLKGEAADIRSLSDTITENKKIYDLIVKLKLPFDLLINEYNYNWVHVSFGPKNRRLQLKAVKSGGKTVYLPVK